MDLTKQIGLGLIAGAVAITINILLLNLADELGIVTARGGLQRLVKRGLSNPFGGWGVADLWGALGLPGPDTALFKTGFKVAVGLLMALGYAVVIEPHLPGN